MAQAISSGTSTQTTTTGTTTTGTTYNKLSPELSESVDASSSLSTINSTSLSTSTTSLSMSTSSLSLSSTTTFSLSSYSTTLRATVDPPVRIIVRLKDTAARISIYDKISRVNGTILKSYNSFGLFAVQVPRSRVLDLGGD